MAEMADCSFEKVRSCFLTPMERAASIVRLIKETELPLLHSLMLKEGWAPARGDVLTYFKADPSGMLCMVQGSLFVGSIATMCYGEEYAHLGLFVICEKERGKGNGRELWRHAEENLRGVKTVGLDAVAYLSPMYEHWGFTHKTFVQYLSAPVDVILTSPVAARNGDTNHSCARLCSPHDVPWDDLLAYDARHYACKREKMLDKALFQEGTVTLVARGHQGAVWGLARVKDVGASRSQGKRYHIGPLFADTFKIATMLLRGLLERVGGGGEGGRLLADEVTMYLPSQNKQGFAELLKLGFREDPEEGYFRMYRGVPPTLPDEEIYGFMSGSFG